MCVTVKGRHVGKRQGQRWWLALFPKTPPPPASPPQRCTNLTALTSAKVAPLATTKPESLGPNTRGHRRVGTGSTRHARRQRGHHQKMHAHSIHAHQHRRVGSGGRRIFEFNVRNLKIQIHGRYETWISATPEKIEKTHVAQTWKVVGCLPQSQHLEIEDTTRGLFFFDATGQFRATPSPKKGNSMLQKQLSSSSLSPD